MVGFEPLEAARATAALRAPPARPRRCGTRCALAALLGCLVGTSPLAARAEGKVPMRKACAIAAERGNTLRDQGKYVSARAAYAGCARPACPWSLAQACRKKLTSLDSATPTVIPRAKDDKGRNLAGVRVSLDGVALAEDSDGRAVPVDPGEHTFTFELPGAAPVEKSVVVRAGEKERLVAVVVHHDLAPTPAAAVAAAPPPPAPPSPAPAPTVPSAPPAAPPPEPASVAGAVADVPPLERASGPGHENRGAIVLGLSALSLALGSSVVGEYFIVQSNRAATTVSQIESSLPAGVCSPPTSTTCRALTYDLDLEQRDLTAGRVLLGVGVGLAIVGAATWLLWPSKATNGVARTWLAPSPARGGGGLYVGGAFF